MPWLGAALASHAVARARSWQTHIMATKFDLEPRCGLLLPWLATLWLGYALGGATSWRRCFVLSHAVACCGLVQPYLAMLWLRYALAEPRHGCEI